LKYCFRMHLYTDHLQTVFVTKIKHTSTNQSFEMPSIAALG
jgi:hypothetical protein